MSLFSSVEMAPRDPILGLNEQFNADTNPNKVNLGVGVYFDDNGKLPLLQCVRDQYLIKRMNHDISLRCELRNYDTDQCLGILIDPLPNPSGHGCGFLTHIDASNSGFLTFLTREMHPSHITIRLDQRLEQTLLLWCQLIETSQHQFRRCRQISCQNATLKFVGKASK